MTPTKAEINAVVKAMEECGIGGELYRELQYEAAALAAMEIIADIMIERCARVAEWFSNVEKFTAEHVAARIRALKEKGD